MKITIFVDICGNSCDPLVIVSLLERRTRPQYRTAGGSHRMVYAYTSELEGPLREQALEAVAGYKPDKICIESPDDTNKPALAELFSGLKSGDTLVLPRIKDLGMSVMDLLDFSLETDLLAVEIISVADNVTSHDLRMVRDMDLEVKTEQECLSR